MAVRGPILPTAVVSFSSQSHATGDGDRDCGNGKWLRQGLWTVATDGGDPRLLLKDRLASNPSYSPDASRIVFGSSRNNPGYSEEASEIYSITPMADA